MYTPAAAPTEAPASNKKALVVLGALAVIAAALGGVLLLKNVKKSPEVPLAQGAVDKLRFVVEPDDATIEIAGKEASRRSPFETELEPGVYTVAVKKAGYDAWSSTITVVRGEGQTVNVVLERAVAHISLDSEPPGLPIVIDGEPSTFQTPAKFDLPAGPHVLSVKSAGGEVWTEELVATADGTHVFTAVLAPKVAEGDRPKDKDRNPGRVKVATTDRKPKEPDVIKPPDPPPPDAAPVAIEQPAPPPPPPKEPPKPARTPIVAVTAVTKLAGEVPTIQVPGNASNGDAQVKMCIDDRGKVTSARVIKSSANIAEPLTRALLTWRYKPYVNKDNEAAPVCFVLQLRLVFKRD